MDRATLLATNGEPMVLLEWLRNYEKHRATLGRLYVQVGWPWDAETMELLERKTLAAGGDGTVFLRPPETGYYDHGQGMDQLIQVCEEPYVHFEEEDLLVRDSSLHRHCFDLVASEPGTICGVVRGSCSQELMDVTDGLPGMWPHMLFGELEQFRKLEERFGARIWQPGESVRGIPGYQVGAESVTADTFGAAAIELRAQTTLFRIASPAARESTDGSTFHVGSVSTGPLETVVMPHRMEPTWDWDYRIAWWKLCNERWDEHAVLDDYRARHAARTAEYWETCPLGPFGGPRFAYDRLKAAINW